MLRDLISEFLALSVKVVEEITLKRNKLISNQIDTKSHGGFNESI